MQAVTAQDVRQATFKVRHVRAGYDISQVDDFLDKVEATLVGVQEHVKRVMEENRQLKEQLETSGANSDETVSRFMVQTEQEGL